MPACTNKSSHISSLPKAFWALLHDVQERKLHRAERRWVHSCWLFVRGTTSDIAGDEERC